MKLAQRVALVTGVSRRKGIGYAIADRLARAGADLYLHGWTPYDADQPWGADREPLEDFLSGLVAHGTRVDWDETDLSAAGAPAKLVEQAVRTMGRVDILIANHAHSVSGTLDVVTARELDLHLAINVRATLLLVKAWAERFSAKTGGRVVLMTSGQDHAPMPEELAYAASKGALHAATLSLAHHLGPRGITVNAVNPGPTDNGWMPPDLQLTIATRTPLRRLATPDDAARLVEWLCTDDARWVTGQVIDSTGGFVG